jgi:uncharacterized protein (TIGR02466 family)
MSALDAARSADLFASPVMSFYWAEGAALNPALRDAILAHEQRNPGAALTNIGGWHSETGLLEFCGEAGKRLIAHMHAMTAEATRRLYAAFGQPERSLEWVLSAWANVNRRGASNQVHTHPGATWSGVYYVDHGEATEATERTGIHLYDPSPARTNLFFPELSATSVVFKPEPGLMILFPSYVPHAVLPHQGERARISIAFNVRREPFP